MSEESGGKSALSGGVGLLQRLRRAVFGLMDEGAEDQVFGDLVRDDYWPGHPPTIEKGRVMCSDCKYHSPAPAGWTYDRCDHPEADYGSIVRNDERAKCCDMRSSSAQCGAGGKWFVRKS